MTGRPCSTCASATSGAPGTPQAVHLPLAQLDKAPQRLPKEGPVVVVCASGMRSRTAAKRLRDLGLDAASVAGGMGAWQRAGGAVRR